MARIDERCAQAGSGHHAGLPGAPGFEAARRFDEAFAEWLQHGTEADVVGRHAQAYAQLGFTGGLTFEL